MELSFKGLQPNMIVVKLNCYFSSKYLKVNSMRFAYVKIYLKIFENNFDVQLKRSIFKTLILTCFCLHNSC